jgi:hypothetical protein
MGQALNNCMGQATKRKIRKRPKGMVIGESFMATCTAHRTTHAWYGPARLSLGSFFFLFSSFFPFISSPQKDAKFEANTSSNPLVRRLRNEGRHGQAILNICVISSFGRVSLFLRQHQVHRIFSHQRGCIYINVSVNQSRVATHTN